MTKVCAIWYTRSVNIGAKNELVEVSDDTQIKNVFGELLFDKNANCLLVNYKNTLYVIEATDRDKSLYSRRTIEYHPLSDLVKI